MISESSTAAISNTSSRGSRPAAIRAFCGSPKRPAARINVFMLESAGSAFYTTRRSSGVFLDAKRSPLDTRGRRRFQQQNGRVWALGPACAVIAHGIPLPRRMAQHRNQPNFTEEGESDAPAREGEVDQ